MKTVYLVWECRKENHIGSCMFQCDRVNARVLKDVQEEAFNYLKKLGFKTKFSSALTPHDIVITFWRELEE